MVRSISPGYYEGANQASSYAKCDDSDDSGGSAYYPGKKKESKDKKEQLDVYRLQEVDPVISNAFFIKTGIDWRDNNLFLVLNLQLAEPLFSMVVAGERCIDVRDYTPRYKRLDFKMWQLIKFTNGTRRDAREHWAIFHGMTVKQTAYHFETPDGTVIETDGPHYVIKFVNLM